MRFETWILALLVLLNASAFGVVRVERRDLKLATQVLLEKQTMTTPILASTTYVIASHAGPTSAAVATISSFTNQPDVPRNIVITPGSNATTTADVESCVVTVTGTDYFSAVLTETFTFEANASTAVTGSKAFKTLSSVAFPADCESGSFAATWSVGVGTKLGLKRCMEDSGHLAWISVDGTYEGTRPTIANSSTAVSGNTIIPSTAMNGAKDVDAFFVQNYRCLP